MRRRGSVPIADNISAYFVTCSALFLFCALVIFRYLQKYGELSIFNKSSTPPSPGTRSLELLLFRSSPSAAVCSHFHLHFVVPLRYSFRLNKINEVKSLEAFHVQTFTSFARRCFSLPPARRRGRRRRHCRSRHNHQGR